METQLFRVPDPEQITEQASIKEIELRRLDQALSEISEVRPQKNNKKTRFKHRKPPSGCGVRDPAICGLRVEIEQLATPTGAKSRETSEGLQVADLDKIPNIPLKIGLILVSQPVLRFKVFIMNAGVKPGKQGFIQGAWGCGPRPRHCDANLIKRQWRVSIQLIKGKGQKVLD